MSNAPAVLATIARPIVSRSLEKIKIKKAGKNEVTRALQLHIYHNEHGKDRIASLMTTAYATSGWN